VNRRPQADGVVEDNLFATLDPTVRRLKLPSGARALLIDTVGVINKLPHGFVDAFKSTLEEVRNADVLLHVVDASDPLAEKQSEVVERVLRELGTEQTPRIVVLNKIDLLPAGHSAPIFEGEKCAVSAATGDGIPALLERIDRLLEHGRERVDLDIPAERGDLVARVHQLGRVLREEYGDRVVHLSALVPAKLAGQLRKAVVRGRA